MSRRKSVGLVSCVELPEPDRDEELLLVALRAAGVEPALIAWDDPAADAGAFELCVLRSCWNYPLDPTRFRRWIDDAGSRTKLWNPPAVVHRNLHKRYLSDLEAADIPIVPTVFVERGTRTSFVETLDAHGWNDAVIKPTISAGSHRTRRFQRADAAEAERFLTALSGEVDTMIQVYVPSVETQRERALVWIDGGFTHAVHKSARFAGQDESVSEAQALTDLELDFGTRVMAQVEEELLYARVDVMLGPRGELLLSELELIEPSLFLLEYPEALGRLVAAILARL